MIILQANIDRLRKWKFNSNPFAHIEIEPLHFSKERDETRADYYKFTLIYNLKHRGRNMWKNLNISFISLREEMLVEEMKDIAQVYHGRRLK